MNEDVYVSASTGPKELPEAGLHNAICAFVEDIGEEESFFEGKRSIRRKVVISWELEQRMADGRPFMLSNRYTASLWKNAKLRQHLEAWRGRTFTAEELKEFKVSVLRGIQCTLSVIRYLTKEGVERAKADTVLKAQKNAPDLAVFSTAPPDWIAEARKKNAEASVQRAGITEAPEDEEPPAHDGNGLPVPF